MGQFRAISGCPICGDPDNGGKWNCPSCTVLVNVHRELVRNLQHWRSLYEAMEVPDVLLGADGREYSLWDIQHFYEARAVCPPRMQQSIQYCLFENMKEKDAAVRMGIKASSPVSIYATVGLTTILTRACSGELQGYTLLHEPGRTRVAV